MDENIKDADLSHLPNQLKEAARSFVDAKFWIDMEARTSPENIPEGLAHSMNGRDFFISIIPFLPCEWDVNGPEVMSVPVAHTLGCSWRWWPDRLKDDVERKVRNHIFSDYGVSCTSYTFILELGLFLPGEGRNRVNFCRYHNIEFLPAEVYTRHYPKAERINLYVLDVMGRKDVWAVLDDRFVQKVSHYAYALPLLRAYGVVVLDKWPKNLPPLQELLFYERKRSGINLFNSAVIDIEAVRGMTKQYLWCGLFNRPVHKKYLYLAGLSLVLLAAEIIGK